MNHAPAILAAPAVYCIRGRFTKQVAVKLSKRVGLKSDGTTGQTTGHLADRGSESRYIAGRKATRQATELTTV